MSHWLLSERGPNISRFILAITNCRCSISAFAGHQHQAIPQRVRELILVAAAFRDAYLYGRTRCRSLRFRTLRRTGPALPIRRRSR